jgi:hypothetical protein
VLCRAGASGLVGGTFGLDAGLDGGEKSRGLRQCQTGAKKADKAKRGKKTQTIMDTMWDDLDQQTAEVMIEGAKTLAMIWDSAWKAGGGDALDATPGQIDANLLRDYYTNPEFAPSLQLEQIGPPA